MRALEPDNGNRRVLNEVAAGVLATSYYGNWMPTPLQR